MINIKKVLSDVPEDKAFITHRGARLLNLEDLREEIKFMSEPEFREYVNNKKNDFANWIEYVIGDKELADRLRETQNKEKTFNLINSRIIFLKIKLENQEENELNYVEREIERLKQTVKEEEKEAKKKIETEEKEEIKKNEEEERLLREIERQIRDLEKSISIEEKDDYKEKKETEEEELLRRLRELNEKPREPPRREEPERIKEHPKFEGIKEIPKPKLEEPKEPELEHHKPIIEPKERRIEPPLKEPEHPTPPKKPEGDERLKEKMRKLEIALWATIGFVAGMILGKII